MFSFTNKLIHKIKTVFNDLCFYFLFMNKYKIYSILYEMIENVRTIFVSNEKES